MIEENIFNQSTVKSHIGVWDDVCRPSCWAMFDAPHGSSARMSSIIDAA